jgi:hypothetical protein
MTPSRPSVPGVRTGQAVDLEAIFLDQSELTFDLALDPMSLVSEAEASAAFARSLPPQLSRVPFLIAAPVALTVACRALPSPRHPGTVVYPNLERWLRPLIEALSGADRLLVAPSLVGSISVATRAGEDDSDTLSITLTYPPDRLLPKSRQPGAVRRVG